MNPETFLRRALLAAAAFNLVGTLLFAFPGSFAGQLAGLPAEAPAVYRALTALFVFLFGGAYAWVALQPRIHRPLVVFGIFGKTGAFLSVVAVWLAGGLPLASAMVISGDLAFALAFAWGLRGTATA